MMNTECVLKSAALCTPRCILKCSREWILEILEYNKQKPKYPRDSSVVPVYAPFKSMGQDLSPAISLLHPSTNSSTSQSLFCFAFADVFYDTTSRATRVSIPILFLTCTTFSLITPILPCSSMRIFPYGLLATLTVLNMYPDLCMNILFINLVKSQDNCKTTR